MSPLLLASGLVCAVAVPACRSRSGVVGLPGGAAVPVAPDGSAAVGVARRVLLRRGQRERSLPARGRLPEGLDAQAGAAAPAEAVLLLAPVLVGLVRVVGRGRRVGSLLFDGPIWTAPESAPASCPFADSWPSAWIPIPEPPDWLCHASWWVEFELSAVAVESAVFDWETEPSSPGLHTRTGVLELPPAWQPHSERPKSWSAADAAKAPCSFTDFWPATWMPRPPSQPHSERPPYCFWPASW
jgi:hypothetical protein